MSRATDTLNQTTTLKDVVKPGPITTLNIQMDIYIATNDETGTSRRQKARKSQKIFQKLSSTRTRRTIHTSRNKAIIIRLVTTFSCICYKEFQISKQLLKNLLEYHQYLGFYYSFIFLKASLISSGVTKSPRFEAITFRISFFLKIDFSSYMNKFLFLEKVFYNKVLYYQKFIVGLLL